MPGQRGEIAITTAAALERARDVPSGSPAEDYPVREYIGAMARELAQMARWDGDEALGDALEAAAEKAERPAPPERRRA